MTPQKAAQRLREIAKMAREEGTLSLYDLASLVHALHPTRKAHDAFASAETLEKLAEAIEGPNSEVSRAQLATLLSRLAMEAEFNAALRHASKPKLTQEYLQLGSVEEVKKKFKAENPGISDSDLDEIAKQWQTNKDVVKDKTALAGDVPGLAGFFEDIKKQAIAASRAADAGRWRQAMMNLFLIVDDIGTILVQLGSMDTQKTEILKREIRQVAQSAARTVDEMGTTPVLAASAEENALRSRFEQGVPADPTQNMAPDDAKEWKAEHEKNKDNFKSALSIVAAEADISKLYDEMSAHFDTFDLAWSRYEKDPEKNRAKLDDALRYMKAIRSVASVIISNLEKKTKTAGDDKRTKFEEGKPADPTENMSPEDAKKWKVEHAENKDNFKSASVTVSNVFAWKA